MIFSLTISEEYEVVMKFHLYRSAIAAKNNARAAAILSELDVIVQKALNQGRLPDDELNKIILFTGQHPELKDMASKSGLGYSSIINEAYPRRPYNADVAKTLELIYY
ncbi:hypothetical protein [Pseudomonas paraveronii]|uniref:hypothetical protein n=1 Tax=Pseudomonas paraveronii TaxID=3040598 RepID=UPI002AB050D7|nr:hypothetical protein [Pseudomonas sp. FLM 11]